MEQTSIPIPVEDVLAAVEEQRNAALSDAAQLRVLARQLMAERDQLAAELEQLRAGDTDPIDGGDGAPLR